MPDRSRNEALKAKCLFSIDVEDWFHILDLPSVPSLAEWDRLPSRVEKSFMRLLEILNKSQIPATCFFLGWVAEKYPHLIREAVAAGHEPASHGYSHRLVYQMTPQEFYDDAAKARTIIEDIAGRPVRGYRAPGFSVTAATPWFFEMLSKAGYRYDSSIFPAARGHGGLKTNRLAPYRVGTSADAIVEIPISVARLGGRPFCFFGGGYFRLFPYRLIRYMADRVLAEGRPINFYIHPREIDPGHPRLPMSLKRRFKSYVNLPATEPKIRRVINDFDWIRFGDYIDEKFPSGGDD